MSRAGEPTRVSTADLGAAEAAELLLEIAEGGGSAAVAVVVGGGARAGDRIALVRPGGAHRGAGDDTDDGEDTPEVDGGADSGGSAPAAERVLGTLGDDTLDAATLDVLRSLLDDPRGHDGLREVGTVDASAEVYVEVRRPVRELVVVGAGHVAQPMAHLGALLGYRVTVLDDRPDFATRERFPDAHRLLRVDFSDPFADVPIHGRSHLLLVTRGHKYDYECLVRALRADPPPAYVGMIGSRRRVRATYVQLLEDGVARERLDRIHAPVGLDVGAETPEEIAVAVAAELVKFHRGGSGLPLKDVERVAERFFKEERP